MRMSVAQARKAFPAAHIPKAKRQPRAKSAAEELFALQLLEYQYEHLAAQDFEREWKFALGIGREWRFDFAWPALMVAVEIEGLRKKFIDGVPYAVGRHCTFLGFTEDCVKYAHAAILGWSVLRFNQALVKDGTAMALTRQLMMARRKA